MGRGCAFPVLMPVHTALLHNMLCILTNNAMRLWHAGGYVVALRDVVPDVGLWQTDPCIPWSGVSWARRAHDDDCIYK